MVRLVPFRQEFVEEFHALQVAGVFSKSFDEFVREQARYGVEEAKEKFSHLHPKQVEKLACDVVMGLTQRANKLQSC